MAALALEPKRADVLATEEMLEPEETRTRLGGRDQERPPTTTTLCSLGRSKTVGSSERLLDKAILTMAKEPKSKQCPILGCFGS